MQQGSKTSKYRENNNIVLNYDWSTASGSSPEVSALILDEVGSGTDFKIIREEDKTFTIKYNNKIICRDVEWLRKIKYTTKRLLIGNFTESYEIVLHDYGIALHKSNIDGRWKNISIDPTVKIDTITLPTRPNYSTAIQLAKESDKPPWEEDNINRNTKYIHHSKVKTNKECDFCRRNAVVKRIALKASVLLSVVREKERIERFLCPECAGVTPSLDEYKKYYRDDTDKLPIELDTRTRRWKVKEEKMNNFLINPLKVVFCSTKQDKYTGVIQLFNGKNVDYGGENQYFVIAELYNNDRLIELETASAAVRPSKTPTQRLSSLSKMYGSFWSRKNRPIEWDQKSYE